MGAGRFSKFVNPDLIDLSPIMKCCIFHMDHHLEPSFGAAQSQKKAREALWFLRLYLEIHSSGDWSFRPSLCPTRAKDWERAHLVPQFTGGRYTWQRILLLHIRYCNIIALA